MFITLVDNCSQQFLYCLLSSGSEPVLPLPSQRREICEAGVEVETVQEPLDEGDRVPDLQEPHVDHQREDGGRGQLCGERGYGVLPERLEQGRHRVRVSLVQILGVGVGLLNILILGHQIIENKCQHAQYI